jgi:hypothetical protein
MQSLLDLVKTSDDRTYTTETLDDRGLLCHGAKFDARELETTLAPYNTIARDYACSLQCYRTRRDISNTCKDAIDERKYGQSKSQRASI